MDGIGGNNQVNYRQEARETMGTVGAASKMYRASRAAQGLVSATRLTQALDIAGGLTSGVTISAEAGMVMGDGLKAGSQVASGLSSAAATTSKAAKFVAFAGKAAPIVAKGSAVLGGALGAIDVGRGINDIHKGNTAAGKKKIVGGACDIVTAGAMGLAATGIGAPVALAVAGGAQAFKYREQIGDGAKWVGQKGVQAGKWIGKQTVAGAQNLATTAASAGSTIAQGAGKLTNAVVGGLKNIF